MPYKQLWILVEGDDDERFFEKIKPALEKKYDCVQPTYKYQQKTDKQIKNFLKSIKAMRSSYFFLRDINRAPCVTAKKNSVRRKYGTRIDVNNVIIVVKEIESWYLAGLNNKARKELGIRTFHSTDQLTKEDFDNLIPKKFDSRIDFMVEILKRFSIDCTFQKNNIRRPVSIAYKTGVRFFDFFGYG